MKNGAMERLRELSKIISEIPSKTDLELEMGKIKRRLNELQPEIIKARALSSPEAEKLKSEKESLTARLEELKESSEIIEVKRKLLEEEKSSIEHKAKIELFNERWPIYERAVLDLMKKLREAEEAERKALIIKEKADEEFRAAGGFPLSSVLPAIRCILIKATVYAVGSGQAKVMTAVDLFAQEAEKLGIKIPDELNFDEKKGAKRPFDLENR